MNITLYFNKSEKQKIGKNLTNALSFTGTLRDETSIIDPVIMLETDNLSQYNYCYIPQFHRYYFIDNIEVVRQGLWRIRCHVDVLESHKSQILNLRVILSDTQDTGAFNYLTGEQWKSSVKAKTDIIKFSNGLLDNGTYILITAGG